jgi:hypothetical protein
VREQATPTITSPPSGGGVRETPTWTAFTIVESEALSPGCAGSISPPDQGETKGGWPGLCQACEETQHLFCNGVGFCECDLCVPYELRGVGALDRRLQLKGALVVIAAIFVGCLMMVALNGCAANQYGAALTGGDFCQGQDPAKSSAVISITTVGAGEHQLVAAVANQVVQVCSYRMDLGGTTPIAEFDYGTQSSTACDTGTTALTGAMSNASLVQNGPLDYFTAPAGNQLCLKLGGTSPTAVGVLTYVQK